MGSAAEPLPDTCGWTSRRTYGLAAAAACQGESPEHGKLRCSPCGEALGLGIGLLCARQGCKLFPQPCAGQEPWTELLCSPRRSCSPK